MATKINRQSRVSQESLAKASGTYFRDILELSKPNVVLLVTFTGLCGVLTAPSSTHFLITFGIVLAIAMGAGAAAMLNMWYDADMDKIMSRTSNRPLPQKRLCRDHVLQMAVLTSLLSALLMLCVANLWASLLLTFSILFYGVFYTMLLKRRTDQNIVIGGLAGALPPAIGWLASTGSLGLVPILMVAVIFLWTPAHFWALAIYRLEDYKTASVPMLPITKGIPATQKQIVLYTLLTVAASVALWFTKEFGVIYAGGASVLGLWFIWGGVRLLKDKTYGLKFFRDSILYIFLLFIAMIVDKSL